MVIEIHTNIVPQEIVDVIIDYVDYKKYHILGLKEVLIDLVHIKSYFHGDNNLPPAIAYQCWGDGWNKYINSFEINII
jgi:hypothetical protein